MIPDTTPDMWHTILIGVIGALLAAKAFVIGYYSGRISKTREYTRD